MKQRGLRLISMLLALLLCLPALPASASDGTDPETEAGGSETVTELSDGPAEPATPGEQEKPDSDVTYPIAGTVNQINWSLDEKGTLTITGEGRLGDGIPWSEYKNRIVCVEVKEGVGHIPSSGFSGCTNLKTVSLPKGLYSIDGSAFSNCTSLTQIMTGLL